MTRENRRANILEVWRRACHALRAADALVALGLWDDALSRAYYAAFDAVCAVLLTEGLEARTHTGVEALFIERFTRPGLLDPSLAADLAALREQRTRADYRWQFCADEALARQELARAHRLHDAVRAFLDRGGWLT